MKPISLPTSIQLKDIFKFLLALVLIGIVFSKTSIGQVVNSVRDISWSWLLISFVLFCLVTALKGVQYWVLLGLNFSYSQILKIVVYQNALSNLVANTAGVASYFTMLRMEQNVNFKRSGAVFMIAKIGDLFSTGVFLFISAFLVWDRIEELRQVTIVLLAGIVAALVVFIAIIFFRMKFVVFVGSIIRWLRFDRFRLVNSGLDLIQFLAGQNQWAFVRIFLLTGALSMIYMTATMIYYFSKVQVFHIPLDFWASVYIVSLFQVISMIPIQVLGGLGVSEYVTIYFFTLFGITYIDVPAALIGRRILTYLFNLFSLFYLSLDTLMTRLRLKNQA